MSMKLEIFPKPVNPNKYNYSRITKKLWENMSKLWRDATREAIRELINHIGVDSGMSAASVQPLAAKVGLKTAIHEPLRGKGPKFKKEKYYGRGEFAGPEFKSITAGRKMGERAYSLKFGTPNRPLFDFEFRIVVFQYYVNEFGLQSQGGVAWNSLEYAETAFTSFIDNYWQDYIPDLNAWFYSAEVLDA